MGISFQIRRVFLCIYSRRINRCFSILNSNAFEPYAIKNWHHHLGVGLPVAPRVETEDSSSEPTTKLYTQQIVISLVGGIVQLEYCTTSDQKIQKSMDW